LGENIDGELVLNLLPAKEDGVHPFEIKSISVNWDGENVDLV